MADLKQELIEDLVYKIAKRKKWETRDFITSQLLVWFAIITSFVTTITAVLKAPTLLTAVLAGLSGVLILIDKNFTFSKRSTWNALYRIKLEKLKRELEFKDAEIEEIADQLTELDLKMERDFPNADFKTEVTP